MDSVPPRRIGRYLLFDAIAQGGMATVYLARLLGQEGFARTVAVKQLYPHFALDRDFVAMFLDEARLSSRIRHPNVVAPLDILVEGSELFIVMEYVHGESLAALNALQRGPWPPAVASAILMQVLLGLHAAHEATGDNGQPLEIVHRDVSPQNVLVGADGVARVVDFGIAKAASRAQTTQDGRLKGKLGYMAPEQIRQLPTDRRVDVFTSGVVLWELLTGRQLFGGDNPGTVLEAILTARIPPPTEHAPGLPPALEAVVLCALATNPDERFDTARAMAAALAQALPPASTLEVSAFVEELAGAALSGRNERVLEIEKFSTGDVPAEARSAAATDPGVVTPAGGATVTAVAPPAAPLPHTDLSLIPSSASHAIVTGDGPKPRRRLAALAAVAAVAAAATLFARSQRDSSAHFGSQGVPASSVPTGEPEPRVQAASSSKEPRADTSAADSLAPAPNNLAPSPNQPAPALSGPAPALNQPASVEAKTAASSAPSAAQPARTAPAVPQKTVADAAPRMTPPAVPVAPPSKRASCSVPYVIDAKGIKRFKAECF